MKKKIYLIATILLSGAVLLLSSCLKDPRYVDFSKGGTVVDFPLGGLAHFGDDAITEAPDSTGTIVRQFAVNVASPNPTTSATTLTLAVDTTIVAAYNASQTAINYLVMPAAAYSFTTTTITIPGGKLSAATSVTFHKNLLDPSKSYMLPIRITSTTAGKISGNMNIHYYHFIGNDFAGVYERYYTRWSNGDTTTAPSTPRTDLGSAVFNPVSPTEFTVQTNYYTQPNYDVTFTKTGNGASAVYSNWAIRFLPADVAPGTTWGTNITVTIPPQFLPKAFKFDPNAKYTYAQSLQLFRFYFHTATRAIIDDFVHH
ncbi:MAG: DUF1735 domain-containing protein [Mucilaginibacter sp.]|nr:DUF1735 domain-containing protein [Mucilaginibacter sp.]